MATGDIHALYRVSDGCYEGSTKEGADGTPTADIGFAYALNPIQDDDDQAGAKRLVDAAHTMLVYVSATNHFRIATVQEIVAHEAKVAAANLAQQKAGMKDGLDNVTSLNLFRAFIDMMLDELNVLRSSNGLPGRTKRQLITELKAKIDADV